MGAIFSRHIEKHVDRALRIKELELEIQSLKDDNDCLRHELAKHRARTVSAASPPVRSEISASQVDAFIEALLADPNTNMSYVPDLIERPLERKMLLYVLNSLAHIVDSAQVNFMGHQLMLRLQPSPPTPPPTTDSPADTKQYSEYDDDELCATTASTQILESAEKDDKGKAELINVDAIPL